MGTEYARKIRGSRARALKRVNGGNLRATLVEVPRGLYGVPVYRVLLACPGIGETTCRDILQRANVWPFIPVDDLTAVEKDTILQLLGRKAK